MFEEEKKRSLEKLSACMKDDLVDVEVIPILEKVNELPDFFTTSSCFGRIQVIEMSALGEKHRSNWLGKWHREPTIEDVNGAINQFKSGLLFFMAQSPILHVMARDIDCAQRLRNMAVNAGFKYTNIKSIKPSKVMVEVLDSARIDLPLGKEGKILSNDSILELGLELGNEILRRGRERLKRFEEGLEGLREI